MQGHVPALENVIAFFLDPVSDSATNTHPLLQRVCDECAVLLGRDDHVCGVSNVNGELCPTYPPTLLLVGQTQSDASLWLDLFERARLARARTRFPVPVARILGRLVCRSATLSVHGEAVLNNISHNISRFFGSSKKPAASSSSSSSPSKLQKEDSMVGRNRQEDIALLQALGVRTIFDLMKEHRKKKFGLVVTSSEKADSYNRYNSFRLNSLPFPGTEGFVNFSSRREEGSEMVPLWHTVEGEDAHLAVHVESDGNFPDVDWRQYTRWPLRVLTSNYLRLMLHALASQNPLHADHGHGHAASAPTLVVGSAPGAGSRLSSPLSFEVPLHGAPTFKEEKGGGIDIHCLSGWDRTPMFVCLVRCVAWAEARAHESLSVAEFLYLTVCYDWLLFRHRLADRMQKAEHVMLYCFHFLSFVATDERITLGGNVNWAQRKERLLELQVMFMQAWEKALAKKGVASSWG